MPRRVFTQTFGVVAAIIVKNGRVLLIREVQRFDGKIGPDDGKWNHPAGWIEVGEPPLDAVVREVLEETGYVFTPKHLLGVYSLVRKDIESSFGSAPHPIKLIYTGEISEGPVAELQDDVSEIGWFRPEDIEAMSIDELRDLNIKQMVRDYQAKKWYPLEVVSHVVQR